MKVLVSTTSTQGNFPDDFTFVPEAELVGRHEMVCDDEKPNASGCGCGRSFAGFDTHRATTTAMVAEVDMTEEEWRTQLRQTLVDSGWVEFVDAEDMTAMLDEMVGHDLRLLDSFPVGSVLGRRAYNQPDGSTWDELVLRSLPADFVMAEPTTSAPLVAPTPVTPKTAPPVAPTPATSTPAPPPTPTTPTTPAAPTRG